MAETSNMPAPRGAAGRRWLWIVTAVLALIVLGSGVWWFVGRKVWTDGAALTVADREARLREVAWETPRPLIAFDSPDQEYEPSVSPDGDEFYFVRGKAGQGPTSPNHNAHIYVSYRRAGAWSRAKPLAAVNFSGADDLGPRVSADNKFLLFYSNRPGGFGGYDIWAAPRAGDGHGWGKPFNLGAGVNSEFDEYSPAPSPDGQRLYFATNRKSASLEQKNAWRATIRASASADFDLWFAQRDNTAIAADSTSSAPSTEPADDAASEPRTRPAGAADLAPTTAPTTGPTTAPAPASDNPVDRSAAPNLVYRNPIEAPGVNTSFAEGAPCVSPAGDFLYFASDRPGGYGKFDIYRSRIGKDGKFGPVENIGPPINTPDNETDPQLALEGFRLYFSSDRPVARAEHGEPMAGGGYDLFQSDSHEVYPERVGHALPHMGWSWLVLGLSLLALLGLVFFMRKWDDQRLGLLQKCLLISLLLHLLVTLAISARHVGHDVYHYVRQEQGLEPPPIDVALAPPAAQVSRDEIGSSIRQQVSTEPPASLAPPAAVAAQQVAPPDAIAAPAGMQFNVPRAQAVDTPGAIAIAPPSSAPPAIAAPAQPPAPAPPVPGIAALPLSAPEIASRLAQPEAVAPAVAPAMPRIAPAQVAIAPQIEAREPTVAPAVSAPRSSAPAQPVSLAQNPAADHTPPAAAIATPTVPAAAPTAQAAANPAIVAPPPGVGAKLASANPPAPLPREAEPTAVRQALTAAAIAPPAPAGSVQQSVPAASAASARAMAVQAPAAPDASASALAVARGSAGAVHVAPAPAAASGDQPSVAAPRPEAGPLSAPEARPEVASAAPAHRGPLSDAHPAVPSAAAAGAALDNAGAQAPAAHPMADSLASGAARSDAASAALAVARGSAGSVHVAPAPNAAAGDQPSVAAPRPEAGPLSAPEARPEVASAAPAHSGPLSDAHPAAPSAAGAAAALDHAGAQAPAAHPMADSLASGAAPNVAAPSASPGVSPTAAPASALASAAGPDLHAPQSAPRVVSDKPDVATPQEFLAGPQREQVATGPGAPGAASAALSSLPSAQAPAARRPSDSAGGSLAASAGPLARPVASSAPAAGASSALARSTPATPAIATTPTAAGRLTGAEPATPASALADAAGSLSRRSVAGPSTRPSASEMARESGLASVPAAQRSSDSAGDSLAASAGPLARPVASSAPAAGASSTLAQSTPATPAIATTPTAAGRLTGAEPVAAATAVADAAGPLARRAIAGPATRPSDNELSREAGLASAPAASRGPGQSLAEAQSASARATGPAVPGAQPGIDAPGAASLEAGVGQPRVASRSLEAGPRLSGVAPVDAPLTGSAIAAGRAPTTRASQAVGATPVASADGNGAAINPPTRATPAPIGVEAAAPAARLPGAGPTRAVADSSAIASARGAAPDLEGLPFAGRPIAVANEAPTATAGVGAVAAPSAPVASAPGAAVAASITPSLPTATPAGREGPAGQSNSLAAGAAPASREVVASARQLPPGASTLAAAVEIAGPRMDLPRAAAPREAPAPLASASGAGAGPTKPLAASDEGDVGVVRGADVRLASATLPGVSARNLVLDVDRAGKSPGADLPHARLVSGPTEFSPRVSIVQPKLSAPDALFQRDPEQRKPLVEKRGGTPESENSVARALAFLARQQEPDGRWTVFSNGEETPGRRGKHPHDPAVTGLATLAFLTADHTPTREGPYRSVVEKSLDWLVSEQRRDGDLRGPMQGGGADAGNMYDQGICTMALCEAAMMTGDRRYTDAALRAAQFIVKAQSPDGGWRYNPGERGDTSVLGWQLLALHDAEQLGFNVPAATKAGARRYLRSVSSGRQRILTSYMGSESPTEAMTAEGLFARLLLDEPIGDAQTQEVTQFLTRKLPQVGGADFYFWYYASLSLSQLPDIARADDQPDSFKINVSNSAWQRWNARTRDTLIEMQKKGGRADGSWWDSRWEERGGRVFTTAMGTLTLEVYYRYLPLKAPASEAPDDLPGRRASADFVPAASPSAVPAAARQTRSTDREARAAAQRRARDRWNDQGGHYPALEPN